MEWLLAGYIWLFIHRPFEVWRTLGDLYLERVYMLTMIAVWVVSRKVLVPNRLHVGFLLLTLGMVLCWQLSPYADAGDRTVEDYLKIVVFYVLLVTSIGDEKGLRRMVVATLIAFSLYMSHSLLEFFRGRHVYRMSTPRMIGVDATYNDANSFSATLLYALPLTFPFWAQARHLRPKLLLTGYTGLTVLCILLTGSRGALIGLVCLTLMRVAVSQRRSLYVVLLLMASPVGWLALPEALQNRFLTIVDPSKGPEGARQSGAGRLKGLEDGLRLWERSPMFGVGPNAFGKAVGHGFQAHNLLGQVVGELGLIGLLALLCLLAGFWLNAREMRHLCRDGPSDDFCWQLSRAVSISVILLLIMGVGSHSMYRYTWLWYGAFQAIALHAVRRRSADVSWEGVPDESFQTQGAAA